MAQARQMLSLAVVLTLAAPPQRDLLELHRSPLGDGVPMGWRIRPVKGEGPPTFAIREDGGNRALRISGKGAAAWAHRDLETPIEGRGVLRWSWRVLELPAGADLRSRKSEDSALRVYVVFGERRRLFARRDRAIFYTWGNAEPEGLTLRSSVSELIQIVRVAGAMEADGQWREHEADVRTDHRRFWHREPPAITAVGLMQDTDMTRGHAVSEVRALKWEVR